MSCISFDCFSLCRSGNTGPGRFLFFLTSCDNKATIQSWPFAGPYRTIRQDKLLNSGLFWRIRAFSVEYPLALRSQRSGVRIAYCPPSKIKGISPANGDVPFPFCYPIATPNAEVPFPFCYPIAPLPRHTTPLAYNSTTQKPNSSLEIEESRRTLQLDLKA